MFEPPSMPGAMTRSDAFGVSAWARKPAAATRASGPALRFSERRALLAKREDALDRNRELLVQRIADLEADIAGLQGDTQYRSNSENLSIDRVAETLRALQQQLEKSKAELEALNAKRP